MLFFHEAPAVTIGYRHAYRTVQYHSAGMSSYKWTTTAAVKNVNNHLNTTRYYCTEHVSHHCSVAYSPLISQALSPLLSNQYCIYDASERNVGGNRGNPAQTVILYVRSLWFKKEPRTVSNLSAYTSCLLGFNHELSQIYLPITDSVCWVSPFVRAFRKATFTSKKMVYYVGKFIVPWCTIYGHLLYDSLKKHPQHPILNITYSNHIKMNISYTYRHCGLSLLLTASCRTIFLLGKLGLPLSARNYFCAR